MVGDGRRCFTGRMRCPSAAKSSTIAIVITVEHLAHCELRVDIRELKLHVAEHCLSPVLEVATEFFGDNPGCPRLERPIVEDIGRDPHVKHQFNASLHVPVHC